VNMPNIRIAFVISQFSVICVARFDNLDQSPAGWSLLR
jgi:hypothetical protein